MSEKDALLILNAMPGIGNRRLLKAIKYYGSATNIFGKSGEELRLEGVLDKKNIENLSIFNKEEFLKKEKDLMERYGVDIITIDEDQYPTMLRQIEDAPVVLYIRGNLPDLNLVYAIVGSRYASMYGRSIADNFAFKLAQCGVTIISGLAKGIDAAAHRGTLRAFGKTIGVLGCGLMRVYPRENADLYKNVLKEGCIISEFPMEAEPLPYHFPRRNRIVSGLSKGVIVVEAAKKSGALITADFALEQNRDVFAVPGKIDNCVSMGVNDLIKQGAKMVTCVEDILEDIVLDIKADFKDKEEPPSLHSKDLSNSLTENEKSVYNHILDDPVHIDFVLNKCIVQGVSLVSGILLKLEMKGLIKQLPGKLFVRS